MTGNETYEIDKENSNTIWADAISKEMKNVLVAFDILDEDTDLPQGFKFLEYHMIFDVKIEDVWYKVRLVAGGHRTEDPKCMSYSSVVSHETVRIALTIAVLNDLQL